MVRFLIKDPRVAQTTEGVTNLYRRLIVENNNKPQCHATKCDNSAVAKGYCHLHYNRWKRHGDPLIAQRMMRRGSSAAERLELLLDKSGGEEACWPFTGATTGSGYGYIMINKVMKAVHRVAYEESYGPIPGGLLVLHSCDNPPCANPRHLRAGTLQDNMDDKVARNRQFRQKGELAKNSKLKSDEVREIHALYHSGVFARKELSAKFGVSESLISAILTGKRWSHIKAEIEVSK